MAQNQHHDSSIPIDIGNDEDNNNGKPRVMNAYSALTLERHTKNVCWMVTLIAACALLLLLVLCAQPDVMYKKDRVHLLAVVLPIYMVSMVAMLCVRNETKTLLLVIVLVAMVIGYMLAYASQSVMKSSECNV